MTVAADKQGGAAESGLELRRARFAIADAAEALAAVCRNPRASSSAVAAAERRVAQAFARFSALMLLAASLLHRIPR